MPHKPLKSTVLKNKYIQPILQHKEEKGTKNGLLPLPVVIFCPIEDNVTDQQIFFAMCTRLSSQTLNSEAAALPKN